MRDQNGQHGLHMKVEQLKRQALKHALVYVAPTLPVEDKRSLFEQFAESLIVEDIGKDETTPPDPLDAINADIVSVGVIRSALTFKSVHLQMLATVSVLNISVLSQLDFALDKLEELKKAVSATSSKLSFVFVEASLVQAVRAGRYVMLDNVNSAPPEVVERLNSLFETNPFLSLYENSKGDVLSTGNGIHKDFRIFATANMARLHSNKLSSALLNRCIRLWLPGLDQDLTIDNAEAHDITRMLKPSLAGVSGGEELACLCVKFHARVKEVVVEETHSVHAWIPVQLPQHCTSRPNFAQSHVPWGAAFTGSCVVFIAQLQRELE